MPHKFKPIIFRTNSVDCIALNDFYPEQNKTHLVAQLNGLSKAITKLKDLFNKIKKTKLKGIFEKVNNYFDEIEAYLFAILKELYVLAKGNGEIRHFSDTDQLPPYAMVIVYSIHRDLENINSIICMLNIYSGYTKRQLSQILKAQLKKRAEYKWFPLINDYIYQFRSVLGKNESNRAKFSFAYANRFRHLKKKGKYMLDENDDNDIRYILENFGHLLLERVIYNFSTYPENILEYWTEELATLLDFPPNVIQEYYDNFRKDFISDFLKQDGVARTEQELNQLLPKTLEDLINFDFKSIDFKSNLLIGNNINEGGIN